MCPMLLGEKDWTTFVYSNCYLLPFWSFLASLGPFKFWGILMTPSKSRFQSFELDFAKSSHVLLAWWWLRSHHFYFHFRAEMIQFSCTSFAKWVVQPSKFCFEVGPERNFLNLQPSRWQELDTHKNLPMMLDILVKKLQLLEVWWEGGIFLGALSWIYFLLKDFCRLKTWRWNKNSIQV